MKRIWLFLFAVLIFVPSAKADQPPHSPDPAGDAQVALINKGIRLLKQHQLQEAITGSFDKAIAAYEKSFRNDKRKIYAARTQAETVSYLFGATLLKEEALVVSWGSAAGFYYKGYALNEMGNIAEAKIYLDRAAAMSPQNAMVLLELGNLYLRGNNLDAAFQLFQAAAKSAPETSPDDEKNLELAQAWRGIGYVFVEQGKLEEAEEIYLRCLALDKGDQKAADELKYVRDMKMKAAEHKK